MFLKTLVCSSALVVLSISACGAEPIHYLTSRVLSSGTVATKGFSLDPQAYGNYDGWVIQSDDGKIFHLRTETCDFEIGEIPPYAMLKVTVHDPKEGELKFRYGFVLGQAKRLLQKGLVSGVVPRDEDDNWSEFSLKRTGFELGKLTLEYSFLGILTSPNPLQTSAKPRAMLQPACDPKATISIYFGRVAEPAPAALVEVYEFYDVFSPEAVEQFKKGKFSFNLYMAWMKSMTPPAIGTKVGRALLEISRP